MERGTIPAVAFVWKIFPDRCRRIDARLLCCGRLFQLVTPSIGARCFRSWRLYTENRDCPCESTPAFPQARGSREPTQTASARERQARAANLGGFPRALGVFVGSPEAKIGRVNAVIVPAPSAIGVIRKKLRMVL